MTAREIIRCMVRDRWHQSFVLPNYTPHLWWECDVFEITKSDYVREYEVKVTRSDFFADAKKDKERFPRPFGAPPVFENKHTLLAAGDVRGPSVFFYVVPQGLLQLHEIPVWAGLIEVRSDERYPGRVFETQIKDAPRLHKQKVDDAVRRHALGVCYYRMHEMLGRKAA